MIDGTIEQKKTAAMGTPIMKQYLSLKAKNPGALLLFRLGDFYELFDEDARRAAPILELVLTQRQGVPMCGMPHHALAGHLGKLLKRGLQVAIAEQMEDPAQAKGMVARDIVRVVTPGTVLEEELLPARENNFLGAVWPSPQGNWGWAWADLSTGELSYADLPPGEGGPSRWEDEWGRLSPRETLWPEGLPSPEGREVTVLEPRAFLDEELERRARSLFKVERVEALGLEAGHPARPALAALLFYVERNQASALDALQPPRRHAPAGFMVLDQEAIRRLDLLPDGGAGSACLWDVLDHTATAMGGRRLRRWLLNPLMDRETLRLRHDRVEFLLSRRRDRRALAELFRETADVERILSRITAGTATGRDLGALRRTLRRAPQVENLLEEGVSLAGEHPLAGLRGGFRVPDELAGLLERALAEDPPFRLAEGGVIRDGYSAALDEWRALARDGRGWISDLENAEKRRTGIGSLKVGYTSVFGYYLEVSKANLAKAPPEWIRRQTLANAERFVTPELKAQEDRILGAEEKARALERELLAELRTKIMAHRGALQGLADALAETDAAASLAEAAERGRWTRPAIVERNVFVLEKARHPVVERMLEERGGGAFVPNDLSLGGENQLLLVTGPNMGGKSTFLRQAALAAVMAQMGSFVAAERAEVGLVDRVFTRIGAGDNLAAGASTFLVEMREVANVLAHATPRSLVILDEVGRGTSTYDGLAVAGAVVEHLARAPGPLVLFATHYFELTDLAGRFSTVKNFHASAREWTHPGGRTELVFLHQILPGPADRSYGVHVAQMAGLPESVVNRARALLREFETSPREASAGPALQTELFAGHPALDALRRMNPDRLTPIEALQILADLKRSVQ